MYENFIREDGITHVPVRDNVGFRLSEVIRGGGTYTLSVSIKNPVRVIPPVQIIHKHALIEVSVTGIHTGLAVFTPTSFTLAQNDAQTVIDSGAWQEHAKNYIRSNAQHLWVNMTNPTVEAIRALGFTVQTLQRTKYMTLHIIRKGQTPHDR